MARPKPKRLTAQSSSRSKFQRRSGGLVIVLGFILLLIGYYVLLRYSQRLVLSTAAIDVSAPLYFSVNEVEELRVAATNRTAAELGLALRVESEQPFPIFIEQGESSFLFEGTLAGHGHISRTANVFVPFDYWGGTANHTLSQSLGLTLWVGFDGRPLERVPPLPLMAAPIPYHRQLFLTFLALFTSLPATLLGFIVKAWWDSAAGV